MSCTVNTETARVPWTDQKNSTISELMNTFHVCAKRTFSTLVLRCTRAHTHTHSIAYAPRLIILPDAVEDEEELDEDAAERQDSTHDDAREWLCVERLLWDLSRDLIGPHWMLNGLQSTRLHSI